MSQPTPALTIVMPCYNRAPLVGRVLQAWEEQEGTDSFELVAVDDGSTDRTPEILRTSRPSRYTLRPILLEKNAGPAHARNRGIAEAQGRIVMFVGDDIFPTSGFVKAHLAEHAAHPEDGWAVLGKTVWPTDFPVNALMEHVDGPGAQQFSYFHLRSGQVIDFRHFYTSNISLKASLFRKVTPWFDTSFPHAAYEDVELGYRLERDGGMKIGYTDAPLAYHYHYYNVWTFAERQYRCGEMSAIFIRRHPHLRRIWRFERVDDCRRLAERPEVRRLLAEPAGAAVEEAERLALALAGYYEVRKVELMDALCLLVLEYFVLRGMIDGELGPEAGRPARRALLVAGFLPHLLRLVERLERDGQPRDEEACVSLRALARRFALPPDERSLRTAWLFERVERMILPRY